MDYSGEWGSWSTPRHDRQIDLGDLHALDRHPYFDRAYLASRLEHFDPHAYDDARNFPILDGSSRLSPYLRFGLVSPREIYRRYRDSGVPSFLSELGWREFWYHVMHYFPECYDQEFLDKRRAIIWQNDPYLISKIEE